MRNFLITLMLCALTLTTSNVFAEKFDESKRTERFGLSFYDGRPMYIFKFIRPHPQPSGWNGIDGVSLTVTRLRTGDNLADYGKVQADGSVRIVIGNQYNVFSYGYDSSGKLVILDMRESLSGVAWLNSAMLSQGPAAIAQSRLRDGDVGLSVFDSIAECVKTWVLAALIFAGSFLCAKFGFREMLRFAGMGLGGKSGATSLTSEDSKSASDREAKAAERENFEAFRRSWNAIRELGEADVYATGEAFGLTFTDKVVKSNQILQESWSRLSEDERQFLTNEARALAWQDDLIDEKEIIYRRVVMETALGDLEGVDALTMYSNPFDDETSEEDDYNAANRALDEVHYDDEGGYW